MRMFPSIGSAECTVPECVRQDRELSGEGSLLGHELLNTEHGQPCHSWICKPIATKDHFSTLECLKLFSNVPAGRKEL